MTVSGSGLDRLMAPQVKRERFYRAIQRVAAHPDVRTILEIGASSGAGSTEALVSGAVTNPAGPPEILTDPLISVAPELVGESRLVGAGRAVIDPRKLTEYALNSSHAVGGNKAVVFERLGFNQGNAEELMSQLRAGVMENSPIPGKLDRFGARFTVDVPVVGPRANGVVRTGWIFKTGSNTPELTTLFVK